MFEPTASATVLGAVIPTSAQGTVIVVLSMVATILLLLVVVMSRRMTLRVGKLEFGPRSAPPPRMADPEPTQRHQRRSFPAAPVPVRKPLSSSPDTDDSSVHSLDELAAANARPPDPTQPFDLAAVAEAISASETMRAIEALRAVEAKHRAGTDSFPIATVRSFKMPVCPLFVLYEVTGSSPRVHVIPSDMRTVEVGRSPDCAVYSSNPSVSQRHFRIIITPGEASGTNPAYTVELEDCESRNGTWVNHKRIQPGSRKRMKDGDIIEAASSRYVFYYVLRPDAASESQVPGVP